MKFKVWPSQTHTKEKYFKLEEDFGEIYLVACDSSGKELPDGNILYINEHGICICSGLTPYAGIPTDEYRCAKVVKA